MGRGERQSYIFKAAATLGLQLGVPHALHLHFAHVLWLGAHVCGSSSCAPCMTHIR